MEQLEGSANLENHRLWQEPSVMVSCHILSVTCGCGENVAHFYNAALGNLCLQICISTQLEGPNRAFQFEILDFG